MDPDDASVRMHVCVHSWAGADERLDLEKELKKRRHFLCSF